MQKNIISIAVVCLCLLLAAVLLSAPDQPANAQNLPTPTTAPTWTPTTESPPTEETTQEILPSEEPPPPPPPALPTAYPFTLDSLQRGAVVASVRDSRGLVGSSSYCLQRTVDLGLSVAVVPIGWDRLENLPWDHKWDELDDIIDQAAHYGLKVILRVYNTPAWHRPPGTDPTYPPDNPYAIEWFMYRMTRHLKAEARAEYVLGYVIWNEPNIPEQWGGQVTAPWAYVTLLESAYRGAQRGDPTAVFVSAPLAPTETGNGPIRDLEYLDQLYDYGFRSYAHVVGMNGLGFAHDPDHDTGAAEYNLMRLQYLHDIMVANGDPRSAWALEVGWLADSDYDMGSFEPFKVSRDDQWQYIWRAFDKATYEWSWMDVMAIWNAGFARYYPPTSNFYWYDLEEPIYYSQLPVVLKNYSPPIAPPPSENKPDLIIRDLEIMAGDPIVGEEIQIRLRIKNDGGKSADNFVISLKPYGSGSGTSIEQTVDQIEPGETIDFRPFTSYTYDEAGEFDTFAKVDYTNEIDESNEGNNTRTLTIEVSEP